MTQQHPDHDRRERYEAAIAAAMHRWPYTAASLADAAMAVADEEHENEDTGDRVQALEAQVAAARRFAAEMRDFCSPHGVAGHYADQLTAAMDRAKEDRS